MAILLTEAQLEAGRARIVEVTERQAVDLGLERMSMHSIARELGWTATALYRYFENKEAILAAARTAAFDRLSAALEAAIAGPGDIWKRSRDIGDAYVDFAFRSPHAYKLIFALSQPDQLRYPDLVRAMTRARRNMTLYVEQMVQEGDLDADPQLLGHVFWSGLHGIISLEMAGQLGGDAPPFEVLRDELVRRLVRSALKNPARRRS